MPGMFKTFLILVMSKFFWLCTIYNDVISDSCDSLQIVVGYIQLVMMYISTIIQAKWISQDSESSP